MRQLAPHVIVRYLILGLVLAFVSPTTVWADDSRATARVHYQAGVKAYNGGDYKVAIREFSQAQQLAPADLNNYNLALCYDKLGDAEPAVQYYKAYLDKVPGTDKRAEIEASMKRLDSAAKSVAAKRAEEERKAEEARKLEAKRAAEEARRGEEAAKREAEEAARRKADEEAANNRPDPSGGAGVGVGVGSTGTPGSGVTPTGGDGQVDRVNQININQVRDQRVGGAGSGIPAKRRGPAESANVGAGASGGAEVGNPEPRANDRSATAPTGPSIPPQAGDGEQPMPNDKPKATPVYKKWWFWAVLGVSAYVVYSIASDDSKSQARMFENTGPANPNAGGMTLMRW